MSKKYIKSVAVSIILFFAITFGVVVEPEELILLVILLVFLCTLIGIRRVYSRGARNIEPWKKWYKRTQKEQRVLRAMNKWPNIPKERFPRKTAYIPTEWWKRKK